MYIALCIYIVYSTMYIYNIFNHQKTSTCLEIDYTVLSFENLSAKYIFAGFIT